MADFTPGAPLKSTGLATIDNLLPVNRTLSKTLVAGDDQKIDANPAAGDIVFTLPDPTLAANIGVEFLIKRVTNGGNLVSLVPDAGDSIEGYSGAFNLALQDDVIKVYSDGSTDWKIEHSSLPSLASLLASNASFVVTTTPTKFDQWDTAAFTTPNKLEANLIDNRVDVVNLHSATEGYEINLTFNFEYSNNNTVTVQLFAEGGLIRLPISQNGLGSGKPISITYVTQIPIISLTSIELYVSAETGGTITNINSEFQVRGITR